MSVEEMEKVGLVTKVLPREGFVDAVLGVARQIAKLPGESLRFNKQIMMRTEREVLLECNRVELEALKGQVRKKESLEAIAGFAEETERKKREKAKL